MVSRLLNTDKRIVEKWAFVSERLTVTSAKLSFSSWAVWVIYAAPAYVDWRVLWLQGQCGIHSKFRPRWTVKWSLVSKCSPSKPKLCLCTLESSGIWNDASGFSIDFLAFYLSSWTLPYFRKVWSWMEAIYFTLFNILSRWLVLLI